jgi:putative ATP-binding cassette transporter
MAMSMRRGRQPGVLPEAASYGLWNDIRFAARLIARYWSGSDRIWAWGVGGSLAALVGGAVYAAVLLNSANRTFYDALTNRNPDAFLIQSFVLAGVLALVTAVAILRDFLRQLLEIRWRSSLVERYLDRWLRDDDYHRLELCGAIENPDQRIQEDVTLAVRATIKLVIEGTTSAAMLVSCGGKANHGMSILVRRTSQSSPRSCGSVLLMHSSARA